MLTVFVAIKVLSVAVMVQTPYVYVSYVRSDGQRDELY